MFIFVDGEQSYQKCNVVTQQIDMCCLKEDLNPYDYNSGRFSNI